MNDQKVAYQIVKTDTDYVLVSVVPTTFAGDAVNYVCRGTKDYCEEIKNKLENSHEN